MKTFPWFGALALVSTANAVRLWDAHTKEYLNVDQLLTATTTNNTVDDHLVTIALPPTNGNKCPANGCHGIDTCDSLNDLVQYLTCRMPGEATEAYTAPSEAFLSDWQQVVATMLNMTDHGHGGLFECMKRGFDLPSSLVDLGYTLETFTDSTVDEDYCVLATYELLDSEASYMANPYGTVIVRLGGSEDDGPTKNLSIDIPHPLHDDQTPRQGVDVFQGTKARSFILAGAARKATTNTTNTCQEEYAISDAAHNREHTFQAAARAVQWYYLTTNNTDFVSLQLHGMGSSSCPEDDVFLSFGVGGVPHQGSKLQVLRDALRKELTNATISMTGDSDCKFLATRNTQGRLFNGVPDDQVCTVEAEGYIGHFIHAEQNRPIRVDGSDQWIAAINAAYPDFELDPLPHSVLKMGATSDP